MRLIKILSKKKFFFKKIQKSDLIILDNNFSNLRFKNIKSHIFDPDRYYIREFIISLFKYVGSLFSKRFGLIYFKTLIEKINPKIALGHDATDYIFNFKKLFPDKISVCYQFAYIFKDDIVNYKKRFGKKISDYYFAYDKRSEKIMKNFIKSNYIINGSTKVNENLPVKMKKKI